MNIHQAVVSLLKSQNLGCIETQKLYIASKQYNYESDQIALEDFMTCNWAWFKEEN